MGFCMGGGGYIQVLLVSKELRGLIFEGGGLIHTGAGVFWSYKVH